jgi:FKBP-type peptidyl-prolyl cis-trans isomerase
MRFRAFVHGVIGMRPGDTRLLVVPPQLAYGDRGVPDLLPPGATLVFRVRRLEG